MPTLELRRIAMSDRERLRASAERYWKELMPHAQVIQDPARRANLFADQFRFDDPRILLWWVMSNNAEIGFTRLSLWQNHDGSGATINDFFIEAPHRRQGHGSVFARKVVDELRVQGVHRIDLNVRADNPVALTFWRSVGFDLSLYQLRKYV